MGRLVVSQAHKLGVGDVEIGVMLGDDRIVHNRAGELPSALHTAGYDGVRINNAMRGVRFRNARRALLQEKRRHIWRRRDYRTVVRGATMEDRS